MAQTIVSVGEILWDVYPDHTMIGGAPFNLAYRVNCLGGRGLIVSRVGTDQLGDLAVRRVEELGMETGYLQRDESAPTGTVDVFFDEENQPDYNIVRGVAYDNIDATQETIDLVSAVDCICFGTLAQRAPVSRRTIETLVEKAPDALKLLDVNLRKDCYSAETLGSSLEMADVVKLNDDEVGVVSGLTGLSSGDFAGFCAEAVEEFSLKCCVVTLGAKGACALSNTGEKAYTPVLQVEVIDTVGCGDAFTAGFVTALLAKESLSSCLRRGSAVGSINALQKGATNPLHATQVETLLNAGQFGTVDHALKEWAEA